MYIQTVYVGYMYIQTYYLDTEIKLPHKIFGNTGFAILQLTSGYALRDLN